MSPTSIRFRYAAALAIGAVAALAAFTPGAAQAAVGCSDTLFHDATLTHDILECGGDGLTIAADGVDLNLNGYTIDGVGLGAAVRSDGYDNVTIKNGTISDFDYGIRLGRGTDGAAVRDITTNLIQVMALELRDTDSSRFSGLTVAGSSRGLDIGSWSTRNVFSGNHVSRIANDAIAVTNSPSNTFTSNQVTWSGDQALQFRRSPRTTLTGNTIAHNADAALTLSSSGSSTLVENRILDSSDAAFVGTNSPSLTFRRNVVTNVGDSLVLTGSGSIKFIANRLTNVGDGGLFIDGNENVIQDNVLSNTSDTGFEFTNSSNNIVTGNTLALGGDSGLAFWGSNNNVIDNNILGNTSDAGISLFDSSDNHVAGNTMDIVGDAGIRLTHAHRNEILSNSVAAASDSGVSLQDSDENRVYGNTVTFNETGVDLNGANFNVIEANDTTGGLAGGIVVEFGSANRILRNIANATGAHGIWLSGEGVDVGEAGVPVPLNVIEGNTAHDNLANGIFVESHRTRISNNLTFRNAGYGIKAVAGVVGDGNRAHGNGEVNQCFIIFCLP